MTRLYLFETCPYCTRVRMALGLQRIEHELRYIAADDAQTPVRLAGRKIVPILELEAQRLTESFSIIEALSGRGEGHVLRRDPISRELVDWYTSIEQAYDFLCYPRFAKLKPPELQSDTAMRYFRESRERIMGLPLPTALERSSVYIEQIEETFGRILGHVDAASVHDRKITAGDFFAYPYLRNLSLVHGLSIPDQIAKYMDAAADVCRVPLFSQQF